MCTKFCHLASVHQRRRMKLGILLIISYALNIHVEGKPLSLDGSQRISKTLDQIINLLREEDSVSCIFTYYILQQQYQFSFCAQIFSRGKWFASIFYPWNFHIKYVSIGKQFWSFRNFSPYNKKETYTT